MQYAVKCDVPGCKLGYIDGAMCEKCEGNGSVLIGCDPNKKKRDTLPRLGAWLIFLSILGFCVWDLIVRPLHLF
jgi:hypothetical protein